MRTHPIYTITYNTQRTYRIQNVPSFGHELDDKKANARKKYYDYLEEISQYKKYMDEENKKFTSKNQEYDNEILSFQTKNNKLIRCISEKEQKIETLKHSVESKKKQNLIELNDINSNGRTIQIKNEQYNKKFEDLKNFKMEKQQENAEEIIRVQQQFQLEYQNIANGIKAQLITSLINPILTRYGDNSRPILNIFIEDILSESKSNQQKDLYNQILMWVTKQTDSNYIEFDINEYNKDNKEKFMIDLKTILFAANQLKETEGQYSLILLSNFQNITQLLNHNEKQELEEILENCSEQYGASFLLISKGINAINNIALPKTGLKLNRFFIKDLKFGIKSFEEVLSEKALVGKNLKELIK